MKKFINIIRYQANVEICAKISKQVFNNKKYQFIFENMFEIVFFKSGLRKFLPIRSTQLMLLFGFMRLGSYTSKETKIYDSIFFNFELLSERKPQNTLPRT